MIHLSSRFLPLLLCLLLVTVVQAAEQVCEADGTCKDACQDSHSECSFWATKGECHDNPNYMLKNCPKACDMCGKNQAQLQKEISKRKTALDEAMESELIVQTPYGAEQEITAGHKDEEKMKAAVANMTKYMDEVVFKDPGHSKVKDTCKNRCVYILLLLRVVLVVIITPIWNLAGCRCNGDREVITNHYENKQSSNTIRQGDSNNH